MVRNIRGHRILWRMLLAQGAIVGLLSAMVMLAVSVITIPLFSEGTDAWSFTKAVSSVVLGADAATPLTGFDAVPVAVGLVIHLAISAAFGMLYAGIVGMFDLEGWTPVTVIGLVLGAMLFVWSATFVGAGIGPEPLAALPMAALLWGNIAFGLTAGVLLATWADRADLDSDIGEGERVRVFEGDEVRTGLPR